LTASRYLQPLRPRQLETEDFGVTFQVYDWTVVLEDIMANIDEGILGGESYTLTLENEGLVMELNEAYELDEDLLTLVEDTIQGIIDGDIMALAEEMMEPEATEEAEG
jgi:basic membrane lipoprotein Med (substrate-binding protein (PBP1-ABC) superfamily)